MSTITTTTTRPRGRPAGTFAPGSLAQRLSQLDRGVCLLEPETSKSTRGTIAESVAKVLVQEPERQYTITLCYGHVSTGTGSVIRFYQVERTS